MELKRKSLYGVTGDDDEMKRMMNSTWVLNFATGAAGGCRDVFLKELTPTERLSDGDQDLLVVICRVAVYNKMTKKKQ